MKINLSMAMKTVINLTATIKYVDGKNNHKLKEKMTYREEYICRELNRNITKHTIQEYSCIHIFMHTYTPKYRDTDKRGLAVRICKLDTCMQIDKVIEID